jgi:spore maturation protein CgeB
LFDEDETATFGSLDELSSKAAWYLEHPVAREKIWTRALARILKEHTYLHRIERIVSEVVSRFSFPKVGVTITVSQDMIIDQG